MSRTYIPDELRRRVALQASFRCGYCLTSERIVGAPMHVDHLVPGASGRRHRRGKPLVGMPALQQL